MVELAVKVLEEVALKAVPVACVFEIGNWIVSTFLRVSFGGKLWIGGS